MNPIDYTGMQSQPNPARNLLQGLAAGSAIRQQIDQRVAQEQMAQRQQAYQTALEGVMNNPTHDAMVQLQVAFPELSKTASPFIQSMNDKQKKATLSTLGQVDNYLSSGNVKGATDILNKEIEANKNSNIDTKQLEAVRDNLSNNPKAALGFTRFMQMQVMGAKDYKDWVDANQKGATAGQFRTLTPDEVKKLGLNPQNAYQMGPDGKIAQIGGGGVTVNVGDKMPAPPTGYDYERNADGTPIMNAQGNATLYAIPGGPAEQKLKEEQQKKVKRQEAAVQTAKNVNDAGKQLLKMLDNESLLNPVTGTSGSVVGAIPFFREGTARRTAEELISTIKSNIAFKTLSDLKAASPTGGALGGVSGPELKLLETNIASLDLAQDPETLRKNIRTVMSLYGKIMKKVDPKKLAEEKAKLENSETNAPAETSFQPAATPKYKDGQIAKNPNTGERMIYKEGIGWQPMK